MLIIPLLISPMANYGAALIPFQVVQSFSESIYLHIVGSSSCFHDRDHLMHRKMKRSSQ
jgi:hypothetical protein